MVFTLFANGSRVELAKSTTAQDGETETEQEAEARALALRIVDEAKVEVTLKMVHPERIALKWVKQS